jgi:copper chaperone CopZ
MKKLFFGMLMVIGVDANAQFSKVSLQASGLTCSMCSKAVKNALEKVPFVEKVQVDIKNQQYNLNLKEGVAVDFDALSKAVADAGFSVASLKVTAAVSNLQLQKDEHVKIGNHSIHFLNAKAQSLNGDVTFALVDKSFVSAKEFKKYASMTKMACVNTGRMEKCCAKEGVPGQTERIFHAII